MYQLSSFIYIIILLNYLFIIIYFIKVHQLSSFIQVPTVLIADC